MPTTAELLAALPPDTPSPRPTNAGAGDMQDMHILKLHAKLEGRNVPTSTLARFGSLSGLSVRLTFAYFAYWIRSWYKPKQAREKELLDAHLRAALHALETMSYLRGAVAKLGQLLPCFPNIVPDAFIKTLNALHFQAPPMHFALVREQLISEIGAPDEVFLEFDERPSAAASIGQVHRARLKSGQKVAVKIQYPGIARTIQSDMKTLRTVLRPFAIHQDWNDIRKYFDEVQIGFERETDYVSEANNLLSIGNLFEKDDEIFVPKPIAELSTKRVLTMEFVEGLSFLEFQQSNPSQSDRDHYGRLISKALYLPFANRMLYTDAHPGNFIFMPDGRLGLIDCGNVRRFNDEEWKFHLEVDRARFDHPEELRAVCIKSLMMTAKEAEKHAAMVECVMEGCRLYNEPIVHDGPFDYGDPDYLRRLTEWLLRCTKHHWMKQQPMNLFGHRLNFQVPALLLWLKSRVDVGALTHQGYGRLQ